METGKKDYCVILLPCFPNFKKERQSYCNVMLSLLCVDWDKELAILPLLFIPSSWASRLPFKYQPLFLNHISYNFLVDVRYGFFC